MLQGDGRPLFYLKEHPKIHIVRLAKVEIPIISSLNRTFETICKTLRVTTASISPVLPPSNSSKVCSVQSAATRCNTHFPAPSKFKQVRCCEISHAGWFLDR